MHGQAAHDVFVHVHESGIGVGKLLVERTGHVVKCNEEKQNLTKIKRNETRNVK